MAVTSTSNTLSSASALAGSGTLSSAGLGSGLDVNGIVTKLMSLERRPIDQIDTKTTGVQANITAYGTLKSSLSSLQTAAQALKTASTYSATKTTVADTTLLTASSDGTAAPGSYSVKVTQLAKAEKLQSGAFSSATDSIGTGTLTFDFGTYSTSGGITSFALNTNKKSVSVTIPSGSDSLNAIADAINAAKAGISATVLNNGTSNYLSFSPLDPGSANSLRIGVSDTDGNNADSVGLSRLAFDKSTGDVSGSVSFTAPNAVSIASASSNHQFKLAIDGGTAQTLTIPNGTYDATNIVAAMQTVVDATFGAGKATVALNGSDQLAITSNTTPSASVSTAPGNTGDSALFGVDLSTPVAIDSGSANHQFMLALDGGTPTIVTMPDATYDNTTIVTAMQSAVDTAFGSGKATVSLDGSNQLVISSNTTPATALSAVSGNTGQTALFGVSLTAPSALAIAAASSNNAFMIAVDGGTATTVTIPDGSYDAANVVSSLQTAIDSAVGAGKTKVSLNASNQLVVASLATSGLASVTLSGVTGNTGLNTMFGESGASVGSASNMTESVAPQDAQLVIDGVTITKSTNTITDAIRGVTLSLVKESTTATTISVANDNSSIGSAIDAFVKAYNTTSSMLSDVLSYDPTTGKAGALQGEGTVRSIQAQLRATLQTLSHSSGLNGLSDIGVSFQRDGTLEFKSEKLNTALSDPTKNVKALFMGKDSTGTTEGIANKLNNLLNTFLASDGTLTTRTSGLTQEITDFAKRKADLETRLTAIEARYRKQYSDLDTLIASMNQTSTYLTQQLASLPNLNSSK